MSKGGSDAQDPIKRRDAFFRRDPSFYGIPTPAKPDPSRVQPHEAKEPATEAPKPKGKRRKPTSR
jgi:hypothetical protein